MSTYLAAFALLAAAAVQAQPVQPREQQQVKWEGRQPQPVRADYEYFVQ